MVICLSLQIQKSVGSVVSQMRRYIGDHCLVIKNARLGEPTTRYAQKYDEIGVKTTNKQITLYDKNHNSNRHFKENEIFLLIGVILEYTSFIFKIYKKSRKFTSGLFPSLLLMAFTLILCVVLLSF